MVYVMNQGSVIVQKPNPRLGRGWKPNPGIQLNLSCGIRAGLGKGWKVCDNPYSHARGRWLVPSFHVGIVVHLCRVLKA